MVLREGSTLTADTLREHLSGHLASFKLPARVWFRDEALPRIASGKIFKRKLKADYAAELAAAADA